MTSITETSAQVNDELAEKAIKYAERTGNRVFPVTEDKRPAAGGGGHKDASTDPAEIRALFTRAGPAAKYFGVTSDTTVVIDIDLYKPGATDWYESVREQLPKSRTYKTKNGGIHTLVKGLNVNTKLSDCCEVKGHNSYFIPWDEFGCEVINDGPIATASADLIRWVNAGNSSRTSQTTDALEWNVTTGADFHDALTTLAARKASEGLGRTDIYRYLLGLLDGSVAKEPNSERHARWIEASGAELQRIVDSAVVKYNHNEADEEFRAELEATDPEALAEIKAITAKLFRDVRPSDDKPASPLAPPSSVKLFSERLAEEPPPSFVIDRWLPKKVVTTLFGSDGLGKTYLALLIAAELALGRPALGAKVDRAFRSMLLLAEDPLGVTYKRMVDIEGALGLTKEQRYTVARDVVIPNEDLTTAELRLLDYVRDVQTNKETLVESEFFRRLRAALDAHRKTAPIDLLIMDGISDFFDDEENNKRRVNAFMRRVAELATEYDMAILLLGHPAKATDSAYSGSRGWTNKSRSRWLMADDGKGGRVLTHEKASYSTEAAQVYLAIASNGVPRLLEDEQREIIETNQLERAKKAIPEVIAKVTQLGRAVSNSSGKSYIGALAREYCGVDLPTTTWDAAIMALVNEGTLLLGEKLNGKDGKPKVTYGNGAHVTGMVYRPAHPS